MMNKNYIFIFEFVSGGGFNKFDIPSSLFAEGYGMLRCLIADFKALNYEIITSLDYRIDYLSRYLDADIITIVHNLDNYIDKFKDCLKQSKYCFIIAPEFSNNLYNLTKLALNNDVAVLSISLRGISLGTSKMNTYYFFKKSEINTPQTFLIPEKGGNLDNRFLINKFKDFNTPIIIKPVDGVGAESIYYFETEDQIINFDDKSIKELDASRKYIIQEYIPGRHLSVSLIGKETTSQPLILGINNQDILFKKDPPNITYQGGSTPVYDWNDLKIILKKNLKKINLSDFKGYFGIDFIYKPKSSINFIEINPRLTTSYIGIRNILNQNIVDLIMERNVDEDVIQIQNYSKFSHFNLEYTGENSIEDIYKTLIPTIMKNIPELITPPIKFETGSNDIKKIFSCFIATRTKDALTSENRIKKILKKLERKGFNLK